MKKKENKKVGKNIFKGIENTDTTLFNVILVMLCFGLIMCFSASAPTAEVRQGDSYYFLRKQMMWAVIGFAAMIIAIKTDMDKIKKLTGPAYITTLVLLVIVFAMPSVNGARRWIQLGGFSFQPSEFAKISIILLLAKNLENKNWEKSKFFQDFIVCMLPALLICGMLVFQPHFSCIVLIALITAGMMYFSGAKMRHFLLCCIPVVPAVIWLLTGEGAEYRWKRIEAFLHPLDHIQEGAYQTIQALYAIGSGGLFGLGLGESRQKFLYLPEPQNDFIFAVICEELGFLGAILVIGLFCIMLWRCVVIAINTQDRYKSLVVLGVTILMAAQFVINICVVTNIIPVTGMPLPFFSAGGSSLVFVMFAMGLVLNVSKDIKKK